MQIIFAFLILIECVFADFSLPRVKSFSFEKMGFTMEIPRVLAVGNVAVRVMYTRYDHLSPLSKSFYPKIKAKPPEVVVEEVPPAEETGADGVLFFLFELYNYLVHFSCKLDVTKTTYVCYI